MKGSKMIGDQNAMRVLVVSGAVLIGSVLEACASREAGDSSSSDEFAIEGIQEDIEIAEDDVADYKAKFESARHWILSCTDRPVLQFSDAKQHLTIHAINPSGRRGALIRCLTGGRKDDLGDRHVLIFSSATDVSCGENCRPKPEAVARIGDRLLVVTSPGSDYGVEKIQRVSRNVFIVKTAMATHARNYLVFANRGEARYLTNGDVEVEDAKKPTFKITGRKSYWKGGGAFWYDALIDQDGGKVRILDPIPLRPKANLECMSREEFIERSGMDLSGIESGPKICVEF
jgi:hypothetical protein